MEFEFIEFLFARSIPNQRSWKIVNRDRALSIDLYLNTQARVGHEIRAMIVMIIAARHVQGFGCRNVGCTVDCHYESFFSEN